MKRVVRRGLGSLFNRGSLFANRIRYRLFFKRLPDESEYCNSKRISVRRRIDCRAEHRDYLAFIRCGAAHRLVGDQGHRNFDIALNLYATYEGAQGCEYLIVGGVNKYKAAFQFLDNELLRRYKGFIFLDDDLEITYSELSRFLSYCTENQLNFAQPSLTPDSYCSHDYLVNAAPRGQRTVAMVEVMCPFFSAEALGRVVGTFDLSYSTWGLDYLWPELLKDAPTVVDEFRLRHVKPVSGAGGFYQYMRSIGVSPEREAEKLRRAVKKRR